MTPVILFADCDEELIKLLKSNINESLLLIYFSDVDWSADFSPWSYEKFLGHGLDTFTKAINVLNDVDWVNDNLTVIGYSLGGLLALVSSSDSRVKNVGSVSGSLWYPDLIDNISGLISNKNIYVSLGDKEAKTKNKLMSTVDVKTKEVCDLLSKDNNVFFEYNKGNHFTDCPIRLLKAFKYLLHK